MVVFSGGCATHAPVSESVMFHSGAAHPSHDEGLGFGIVGTASSTQEMAREIAAQKNYPKEWTRRTDVALNPHRLSAGVYVSHVQREGRRYAVSGALGIPVAGVDATVQVWGRNYVTAGVSAPQGGQVFLQHRTYDSRRVGVAVGLGWRRDSFSLSAPCAGMGCFDFASHEINSVGARSFAMIRAEGAARSGIKIGAYGGYVPALDSPVLSVSLTIGRW
jgi:hypothetical protein